MVIISLFFVISACSPNGEEQKSAEEKKDYVLTPIFSVEGHEMRGIKDKIGFLNLNFTTKEPQKVLWHFWGDSNDLTGVFRLEGIHLNSGKKVPLLVDSNTQKKTYESTQPYTQENLSAVKTMPSTLVFEEPGIWQLNVFINEKEYAELVIEVSE